jgi:VWFA-related protein
VLKTSVEDESAAPPVQPATTVVEPRDSNAIRIETRLVNLNVKAMDKKGLPLTELKPEDFAIYEDGIRQEIAHFKPVNAPVNVILLMDLSGSTKKKRKPMMDAARKFIDAMPAQDKIQLVAFTRQYKPLSDFTSNKAALKQAVEKLNKIGGGTAFYDATWKALDQLNELREARKAIVVLTDGEDEMLLRRRPDDSLENAADANAITYNKLLQRASEEDVTIYPIYYSTANHYDKLGILFGGGGAFNMPNKQRLARKQLEQLAEQTGGEVVNANYEEDLANAYARVASELHTLYSMAYSPEKLKHDGGFRKIAVQVKRDGSVAKTRRGYYDR